MSEVEERGHESKLAADCLTWSHFAAVSIRLDYPVDNFRLISLCSFLVHRRREEQPRLSKSVIRHNRRRPIIEEITAANFCLTPPTANRPDKTPKVSIDFLTFLFDRPTHPQMWWFKIVIFFVECDRKSVGHVRNGLSRLSARRIGGRIRCLRWRSV